MKGNLLRAVRLALARPTPPEISVHPDANVLAGFAECTLPAREREEIAGHLAACAECREFLVLAFATEVDEPAVAAKAKTLRGWTPVWSWAASLATVCIVVSAVWEFRVQEVPVLGPPPGPAVIQSAQPSLAVPSLRAHASSNAPKLSPGKAVSAKAIAPPGDIGPAAAGVPPSPPPPPAAGAVPTPTSPPLAKQETGDALSLAPQQQVREKDKIAQSPQQATAQAPPQGFAAEQKAQRGQVKSSSAGFVSQRRFGAMERAASARSDLPGGPAILWSIASSQQRGIVERSRDGGSTWQTVPLDDQISFRAVVGTSLEVWAGGSTGALFHSTDAGVHWERVPAFTTATITEIQNASGGDVYVTTDAGQRWLSQDDGRTWQSTDTQR